ncbi:hypothetical protein BGW38_007920 [Lunasporangiospora selenospora]|uniref:Uncharacterized protein n=1 Tax=Lunasporangiospora selenospora TaxID=979761 RepID=A0A9P6FY75_9FUNG|nr:hypothetical protein BGW38_007920 [Lunasporangiospora selenospora]
MDLIVPLALPSLLILMDSFSWVEEGKDDIAKDEDAKDEVEKADTIGRSGDEFLEDFVEEEEEPLEIEPALDLVWVIGLLAGLTEVEEDLKGKQSSPK